MKTSQLATLAVAVTTISLICQQPADARNWKAFDNPSNGVGNATPPTEGTPDPTTEVPSDESSDPVLPVGYINAFPTIVRTGTYPTLDWAIGYPKTLLELADIAQDGTITPREDVDIEVRVIGVSNPISTTENGLVDLQVCADGASTWTRIFYDTEDNVVPTYVYHTQPVRKDQPIDIRGRSSTGTTWVDYHSTGTGTSTVVPLVNGDTPPSTTTAFEQGQIENYLNPYLDDSGHIQIGPKDVIFLIELDNTSPTNAGFDLQDAVVLVTVKEKYNNGHGNNIDGVDMSNPGAAPFIIYDTDPTLDDEAGAGVGAYPSQP